MRGPSRKVSNVTVHSNFFSNVVNGLSFECCMTECWLWREEKGLVRKINRGIPKWFSIFMPYYIYSYSRMIIIQVYEYTHRYIVYHRLPLRRNIAPRILIFDVGASAWQNSALQNELRYYAYVGSMHAKQCEESGQMCCEISMIHCIDCFVHRVFWAIWRER